MAKNLLEGYNCTCFAYGQTGSGKTHTMEGSSSSEELWGIIPRIMKDIFGGIVDVDEEWEFLVHVSYIEIYLEKIRDLLDPSKTNLRVREDKTKGVWVDGCTEVLAQDSADMLRIMQKGGNSRAMASTRMNMDSSRSHAIFIIRLEQHHTVTASQKSGQLFLVDLAGSESVGKTAAKGTTLEEAKHINKSLSALGNVMNALTEGFKADKKRKSKSADASSNYIPYRDSKLTRLLQDSLGGNAKTHMIIACSCSNYNYDETVSTLKFGQRAKSVKVRGCWLHS